MKIKTLVLSVTFLITFGNDKIVAQKSLKGSSKKVKSRDWVSLLDKNLTNWEVWTGVPEPSVKKLPGNYQKNQKGENDSPIGLGDPMEIFTVTEDDGELVLNISGQVYAGLTSKKEYANYHLSFLFKWGERKYEPRLERKRDNGLLYHCHGEHGAFWDVWKSSLEFQIQEGDFGDLYTLAGTKAKVTVDEEGKWSVGSNLINKGVRVQRKIDAESPHGEWTRIDLYVIDDSSVHLTNGKVVMALTEAKSKHGEKLVSGQLQLQSEAAECYMRDIQIRPIKKFPKWIQKQI